jgi:hypothetical protein
MLLFEVGELVRRTNHSGPSEIWPDKDLSRYNDTLIVDQNDVLLILEHIGIYNIHFERNDGLLQMVNSVYKVLFNNKIWYAKVNYYNVYNNETKTWDVQESICNWWEKVEC